MKCNLTGKTVALFMQVSELLSDEQINEIRIEYNKLGKAAFYSYAKKNKVLPYFAHALIRAGCDIEFWEKIHNKFYQRNIEIVNILEKIFIELNNAGMTKVCVAENFASILISDACIGCYCSGDVDLYCEDLDLDTLDKIMERFGFFWGNRQIRKKSYAREYKSVNIIGEEFWINFQWKPMTRKKTHLYDQRYILRRYHEFFEEINFYKNTHIRLFNPEATLYLNCVHISSGHYYVLSPGIRLYVDIDRIVRFCDINWEKIRNWATSDNLGMRTDIVFEISKSQLQTPIPFEAFTSLAKTVKLKNIMSWLMNLETLDYKKPPEGRIGFLLFLTRVELCSDGSNVLFAMIRRLWVILTYWD